MKKYKTARASVRTKKPSDALNKIFHISTESSFIRNSYNVQDIHMVCNFLKLFSIQCYGPSPFQYIFEI